jgi:hypothetical protein
VSGTLMTGGSCEVESCQEGPHVCDGPLQHHLLQKAKRHHRLDVLEVSFGNRQSAPASITSALGWRIASSVATPRGAAPDWAIRWGKGKANRAVGCGRVMVCRYRR